ncbi:MAG: Ig-like domain-containing protein, partial [Gemmatimonadaceae bacterium]
LSAATAYASAGPQAAQQVRDVEFLAFDPIRDSAGLRRMDEALANHVFYVGDGDAGSPGVAGMRRASIQAAALADDEGAHPERTLLLYVNGVFTREKTEVDARNELESIQRELPSLNDPRVVIAHFYNRTWSAQAPTQKAREAHCVAHFWLQRAYMGENSLRPFLAQCMNDDSYRLMSDMDLVECVRQVWSILNGTDAAEVDAVALADSIQAHRESGQHVIVVPHSQGNLMTNQAIHRLRGDGRFAPERDSACIGVVSLASPVSSRWDVRNGNYLAPVVVRGDPIPDLVPGANSWPRIDTELSTKITSNPLYAIAPKFVQALWAIDLHDAVGSYMTAPASRTAIRDGLLGVYRACATSRITVSPASASVMQGAKVRLTASVANAYGDSLPGTVVRWTSESPAVASVDASGMVTGGDPGPSQQGSARIVARRYGARGFGTVNVTASLPTVSIVTHTVPKSVMRVEGADGGSVESTSIFDGELPNNWPVPWDGRSPCDQRETRYKDWGPTWSPEVVHYVQVCWFEYGFSLSGQPSVGGPRLDYFLFNWALPDGTQLSGPWGGLWVAEPSYSSRTFGYWENGFDRMPWSGVWAVAVDASGRRSKPVFAPFTY